MKAAFLCFLIVVVAVSAAPQKRNKDKYNKDKVFVDNTGSITPKTRRQDGPVRRNKDKYSKDKVFVDNTGSINPKEKRQTADDKRNYDDIYNSVVAIKNENKRFTDFKKRNQDKYSKDKVFVDNTGSITPKEKRQTAEENFRRNYDDIVGSVVAIKNEKKRFTDFKKRNQDKYSKDKVFVDNTGGKTKREEIRNYDDIYGSTVAIKNGGSGKSKSGGRGKPKSGGGDSGMQMAGWLNGVGAFQIDM